jgi:hypothetical protein
MVKMETWTVGTAWYLTLPIYQAAKVTIQRESFYKYIKDLYDEAGRTRAHGGIITGVRAELYFNGSWSSVSLDNIGELMGKGTETIFIEKQGIPELITEWADKYGIAMVNTRGKLVEYAKDLMNSITHDKGHALVMTDYDNSGVKIASESPSHIPWLGVNDRMLKDLKIPRETVSVATTNDFSHDYIKYIAKYSVHPTGKQYKRSGEKDDRFKDIDTDFLKGERVELDAIPAKIGNERFFNYIKDRLTELYPKRDYTRVIDIEEDLLDIEMPDEEFGDRLDHEGPIIRIDSRIKEFLESKTEEINKDLKETEGFLEVKEKRKEIKKTLGKELTNDSDYVDFAKKLNQLVATHPFFEKPIEKPGGNSP